MKKNERPRWTVVSVLYTSLRVYSLSPVKLTLLLGVLPSFLGLNSRTGSFGRSARGARM